MVLPAGQVAQSRSLERFRNEHRATFPADPGMRRRSSGSSEDGDPSSSIEIPTTHVGHKSSSNQPPLEQERCPPAVASPGSFGTSSGSVRGSGSGRGSISSGGSSRGSSGSCPDHHQQERHHWHHQHQHQHQHQHRRNRSNPGNSNSRPSSAKSRLPHNLNWNPVHPRNGSIAKFVPASDPELLLSTSRLDSGAAPAADDPSPPSRDMRKMSDSRFSPSRRPSSRNPWAISILTLITSLVGVAILAVILNSLVTRQGDPKGCRMSYMRPSYARLDDFDTEHTRFASKYSLYLYREQGVDNGHKLRGVPVLFIPGNAGSYKQVRPIAAEAANYFHDVLQHDEQVTASGVRGLDFFTADFNEDITAFHGQTLLDQAEYLNEAIRYILSLYLDPRLSSRSPDLPDPTSVIIVGHSMGGIVARTMLVMPNYQANSINTIVTMSAPHARPPVSFDGQIVKIYEDINEYWRRAYSQQWANNNPLWHVTLVSIAGGGLDTVVPSDYASLESLVPDTHGFTVFTSTISTVWTSMDHQAILWCDQFRKVITRALYQVVDVNRATQTKPRAERMRVFKKWFLTGMEDIAERSLPLSEPSTLLTLEDNPDSIIAQGERLVLRQLGASGKARAHLLPIPPPGSPDGKRFTLLTDQVLDNPAENGRLEVLFCSVFPLQSGQPGMLFPATIDLSGESTAPTRLACKSAAPDTILLPASTAYTRHPFFLDGERELRPFSYLQYDIEDVSDHQFAAIIDKSTYPTPGFVVAEFSDQSQSQRTRHISLRRLLGFGMRLRLPAKRPMVTEIRVPALASSLLAYNLKIGSQACGDDKELFAPFLRQFLSEPYESKFFVNARQAAISLHGESPYVPPPMRRKVSEDGITFQFWTDPTCNATVQAELSVDVFGSMGKLYMRYRTVLAAFPLFVVALVLRKQFRVYDAKGEFISFSEALDGCLRQSIPLMLAALTLLSLSDGKPAPAAGLGFWHWGNGSAHSTVDFHQNDLLVGTRDPVFWFMIPLIGLVCIGACAALNYAALSLIHVLSAGVNLLSFRSGWVRHDDKRRAPSPGFMPSSPRRRMITTTVLLFLVSTFIPYQFAYLVACLVQLSTTLRAQRIASELRSNANYNFYNYCHSILILMLWVLPINLPILAVWIHNLAVHWLTPFSSHHNVLSIMPFIVLVETLTTGKMVPIVTSRLRHVTNVLFFAISLYAAIYGVSYAYMLHYLVNMVAAWLVVLHSTSDSWSLSGLTTLYEGNADDRKRGKEP